MECGHCHVKFNDEEGLVYVLDIHGQTIDIGCRSCMDARHPEIKSQAA